MNSNHKIYFYPVWLRIWHGINALGIILLIITGISMQSGVEATIVPFNSLVKMHNIAGVVVTLNYFLFFIGNLVTNNGKFYIVKPKGFLKRPMKQATYYVWGMFHGMKAPYPLSEKRKFNPLQKYFYIIVMYLAVPFVILSGFALLFPEIIIERVYNLSGVFLTAVVHSAFGFFISIFLLIHLYVASIGKNPLENFKSIVSGWHHV
ncbi:MAG TPA: cytochrome b/b6 domain-containing protein [Sunxiuqinia sp.]|nr:cytochrome b/b6 domain-containing protein [Sunxiuqinia sp.]